MCEKIKLRRYTPLPPSTEPLCPGEDPSVLRNLKYPKEEDFQGMPWGIVDLKTGKVLKPMSQEEYDSLFK